VGSASKDVAPERIGAEKMIRPGRAKALHWDHRERIARQPRRRKCHNDEEREDNPTQDEGRVSLGEPPDPARRREAP
jgi:hypothetical protein